MKKRIIAWILTCCFLLSAAPVYAGAATGQQVTADAVTVTAGNTATVTLQAENFVNIAALDVYVYYDAAVFTVSSTANGSILSNAMAVVNTAVAGEITLSTMSLEGMNGSGSLLTVRFAVKADAAPGTYPVRVAIGRAADGALAPATIGGVSGSITVTKPVATETFTIYGYPGTTFLQKGDVLSYRVASSSSSRAFVSGEFTVTYDHELFAFEAAELESALTKEGALYSINSAVPGQVRIAYANENPVKNFYLFTVKLKVIADVAATTTVTAAATNMYRDDLSAYLPDDDVSTLTLARLPDVEDYPDAFLHTERLVVGEQSKSVFTLEAGCGVAAADFRVAYDPAVLRCLGVTKAEAAGDAMVIINDTFDRGFIRFSYVNMEQRSEELELIEILWEPVKSPATHYQTTLSGVGVVDDSQKGITLEYVTDSSCIYAATVTKEPTRLEEGRVDYVCGCGNAFSKVLPAIPNPAAQVGTTLCATLEEALKKAPEGSTVQLLQSSGKPQTVEKSLTLDLNGFDLSGEILVGDGCTLTLLDSQTNDFTVEDEFGYGMLEHVTGNVVSAEGYLLISEENGVSAHRVQLEITDMVLRPSAAGVYYKSEFSGDEVVARNVARFGVAFSLQGQPTPENPGVCSWYDDFTSGVVSGTLLKGIMKTTYTQETNTDNAELEIYGSAYIRTCDGRYIFGDCVSRSLRQQVELIDQQWDTLDAEQKSGVVALYETYAAVMATWDIPNIQAVSE